MSYKKLVNVSGFLNNNYNSINNIEFTQLKEQANIETKQEQIDIEALNLLENKTSTSTTCCICLENNDDASIKLKCRCRTKIHYVCFEK